MSISEQATPSASSAPDVIRPVWRRAAVLGSGAAVLVLAAGGAFVALRPAGDPAPTAPITLPTSLGGVNATDPQSDFAQQSTWRDKADFAAGGATVVGRSYGPNGDNKVVRVVAGRADLTGKLEFTWPVDEGTELKGARCTQNVKLTEKGRSGVRPTVMFCWRTGATLSAYAVVIEPKGEPTQEETVAILDTVWRTARKG